jgi:hypothetical protein
MTYDTRINVVYLRAFQSGDPTQIKIFYRIENPLTVLDFNEEPSLLIALSARAALSSREPGRDQNILEAFIIGLPIEIQD